MIKGFLIQFSNWNSENEMESNKFTDFNLFEMISSILN